MTNFAIAGIQMPVTIRDNLDAMKARLDLLMHLYPWVQMVVFPELAVHGPIPSSAQATGGAYEAAFCRMAREYGVWLIPGSLFEKRDGNIYNTSPVIDPDGNVVTRYSKMFPFTPYESATTPGDRVCVFDVPGVGRFGISICYDIWFPELTRSMVSMGAEVIINPVMANFTDRPVDLVIAQASAAMFQSYVFHINGLVAGGNGQSMVIDPTGHVIHRGGNSEELIPIEVDLAALRRQRVRGLMTMGQPLKSWRDCAVPFPAYAEGFDRSYLDSLGPLVVPPREVVDPAAGPVMLPPIPGAVPPPLQPLAAPAPETAGTAAPAPAPAPEAATPETVLPAAE